MKINQTDVNNVDLKNFYNFKRLNWYEPKFEKKPNSNKFINSLTNQQLEKITQFVQSVPTLHHEQKYKCKKCEHENTLELRGLQDFF